ncbi:MAG: cation transporter [Bdellovibrionales bacterium]|nr:cation transporter [Bdellovibrionales bacterium]
MGKGHAHSHAQAHDHGHSAASSIGWAFGLNLGFALIELVGGVLVGSMAVLADAAHDLGDSLGLGLAWILQRYSLRGPTERYLYGYGRLSVLSALISGATIVTGSVVVLVQTVPRFWEPGQPYAPGMVGLAVLGIAVNGVAAWRLSRGSTLNERMLQWHLLEDALGWVAVLVGAGIILQTGWTWVDPLLAAALAVFILWNAVRRLIAVLRLLLQSVPEGFDSAEFLEALRGIPGVSGAHGLKAWSVDGHKHVLSVHLELEAVGDAGQAEAARRRVRELAAERGHFHVTVETETQGKAGCDDH